ncbi:MAG: molybdate ABC transporter permease subunit, partial [Actinomycetota bacterium]
MTRSRHRLGPAPAHLVVLAGLGLVFLLLPLGALLARTPLRGMPERITDPVVLDALWLSVWTATASTAIALVVGLPMAWALARVDFPGRSLV